MSVFNIYYLQESISLFLCIGPRVRHKMNLKINLDRLLQSNSFFVVVIMDFSVKSSKWYYHEKSRSEGNAVNTITKQYGPHWVINKHIY